MSTIYASRLLTSICVLKSTTRNSRMRTPLKSFKTYFSRNHLPVCVFLFLCSATFLHSHNVAIEAISEIPNSDDTCILVGINPGADDLWQFSARSLCLSSNICFDPKNPGAVLYHSSDLSKTKCHIYDSDFTRTSGKFPEVAILNATKQTCQSFQHQFVICAHGTGLTRAMPVCPKVQKMSSRVGDLVRWLDHPTLVVPDYAFSKNIYHYLNPIADLARTVEHLPELEMRGSRRGAKRKSPYGKWKSETKNINIIFQGLRRVPLAHLWKQQLLELIIRQRMLKRGINVNLFFMEDFSKRSSNVCLRNAVLLGRRGHYNVWPFPNKTEVPLHGFSVPLDAVRFKQAVYDGLGVNARLPQFPKARGGYSISEPPPFTVGYAKRDGRRGSDGYYRGGAMRKFFREDEEWFTEMLRNETEAAGAELIIIPPKKREGLQKQVTDIIGVGFLIGIHGANLVNCMFMHPFGVLMEILPKNVTEECYIAGANSGLKYLRMECSKEVNLLDSGCHPQDFLCKVDPRQRGVDIRRNQDRKRIRHLVRQGLEHLRSIRTRFPDGIHVKYNPYSTYYDVVE